MTWVDYEMALQDQCKLNRIKKDLGIVIQIKEKVKAGYFINLRCHNRADGQFFRERFTDKELRKISINLTFSEY